MNIKASSVTPIFIFAIVSIFIVLGAGFIWYISSIINSALDVDIDIGQVNLQDINNKTFGQVHSGLTKTIDYLGLAILLGMVLFMFGNAYFFGDKNKIWIPVDIFIIVFIFVVSVYISQIFDIFINSDALFSFFNSELPNSSRFMRNLPIISVIVGSIVMIITYLATEHRDQMELSGNVYGYSEG